MHSENFIKFSKVVKHYDSVRENAPQYLTEKPQDMAFDNVLDNLQKAHIFEMSNTHKKLLVLSEPSTDIDDLHLPFDTLFLDVAFTNEELDNYGIKEVDDITGILARGGMLYEQENMTAVRPDLLLSICFTDYEKGVVGWETMSIDYKKRIVMDYPNSRLKKKTRNFLYKFFLSFLNFMNHPEVEYTIHNRSAKSMQRRILKGLPVIPSTCSITVTGKIKQYLDTIEGSGNLHLSHKYWVRGHFRRLAAERYKVKKTMWIFPHIRGKGNLIEKEYILK